MGILANFSDPSPQPAFKGRWDSSSVTVWFRLSEFF